MAKAKGTALRKMMAGDVTDSAAPPAAINKVEALLAEWTKKTRELADLTEKQTKAAEAVRELEQVRIPMLVADELGFATITLPDGTTVAIVREFYPNVTVPNQPALFAWLAKIKCDGMIKNELKVAFSKGDEEKAGKLYEALFKKFGEAVARKRFIHPGTFKAFVVERVKKGEPFPPIVNLNEVRTTQVKRKV